MRRGRLKFGAPNRSAVERIVPESRGLEHVPEAGEGRSERPASVKSAVLCQTFNAKARKRGTTCILSVRLPSSDMERLRAASGARSISDYVRARLFAGGPLPASRSRHPVQNQRVLGQLLAMLGQSRMGESLASLARDAHAGSLLLDDVTLRQIAEAHESVCLMRDRLVEAMGLIEAQPRS